MAVSVTPFLILLAHMPRASSATPWIHYPLVALMTAAYIGAYRLATATRRALRFPVGAVHGRRSLSAALVISLLILAAAAAQIVLIFAWLLEYS